MPQQLAPAALALALLTTPCLSETRVTRQRLWEGVPSVAVVQGDPVTEQRGDAQRSNRWMPGGSADPVLTIYHPDKPNGAACVVCPGGGYRGLAFDKEGLFVAKWLAERGVLGAVLPYRCGGGANAYPVPQQDGQRAIAYLRATADRWGIDPNRVGVMGFSAGGHLAASVATQAGGRVAPADDPLAEASARPDFAVLIYPVISMRGELTNRGSRNNLIGQSPDEESVATLSADEQVDADTPPTFLVHTVDDGAVPVSNSVRFFEACHRNDVDVELHVYPSGGHGYGMWSEKGSVAGWPAALENWLVSRGYANP